MLKWMVSLGLSLLTLGTLLFTVSQTMSAPSQSIEVEALIYEDRFEMKRVEVKIYNFTFPSDVTIIATIGSSMCVGLKIYGGERYCDIAEAVKEFNLGSIDIEELLGKLPKPISWSHSEYYKHVIPNNQTATYYFMVYNYPACYPKKVYLKVGYTTGRMEPSSSKPIEFKNQLLSAGLATLAIGFLTFMYGLVKEPKI